MKERDKPGRFLRSGAQNLNPKLEDLATATAEADNDNFSDRFFHFPLNPHPQELRLRACVALQSARASKGAGSFQAREAKTASRIIANIGFA